MLVVIISYLRSHFKLKSGENTYFGTNIQPIKDVETIKTWPLV
jgi:hypothetical protein